MPVPIITFTTDFGSRDAYVAQMKAAVLHECRDVHLVDVTHEVEPQDVIGGSIALERAIAGFPAGTTHVAVVDPGVGTDRKLLMVHIAQQTVLCPDNGLITWAWRRHGPGVVWDLSWRPRESSHTFHGRDVLAPVAGKLAAGESPMKGFCSGQVQPQLLDVDLAEPGLGRCQVIHIDRYGNATTNLVGRWVAGRSVLLGDRTIGPVRTTYADVDVGQPLALIGSSELLEVAVRNGSAARTFGIRIGDAVSLQ